MIITCFLLQVAKGEPPQQPICILNIVLPETILPESTVSEPDLLVLHKKYSFLRDGGLGEFIIITTCFVSKHNFKNIILALLCYFTIQERFSTYTYSII